MYIPTNSVENIYTQLFNGAKRSLLDPKNLTAPRTAAPSVPKPFVWNSTTFNGTRNGTIGTNGTSHHNSTKIDNHKDNDSSMAFIFLPFVIAVGLFALLGAVIRPAPASKSRNTNTNTPLSTRHTPTRRTPRTRRTTTRTSRHRTPSPWRSNTLPQMIARDPRTSTPSSSNTLPEITREARHTAVPNERSPRPYPHSASRTTNPSPPPAGVASREPRPYGLTTLEPIPMSELRTSMEMERPPPPAYEIRRLSEDVGHAEPPPIYRTQTMDDERVLVEGEGEVEMPAPVYRREWNPWNSAAG